MIVHRPLFWQQGLFLQPQHFQLLEPSFRDLLTPVNQFMTPYFWGVGNLEISSSALANKSFDLLKGTFLFKDGTYVDLPGNAVIKPRSFDDSWSGPLTVHLGLKTWNESGRNVTIVENLQNIASVTTRFAATTDADEVNDLHAGGPAGRVRKMHYVLKLFWESEVDQASDYLLIPIAQLNKLGADVRLSPDYIPPCLTLGGSGSLNKLVSEIRNQLTARSHQLEEFKKKRGVHSAEFGSRDMVYILALRTVNRYVPLLHHYDECKTIHPWIVYGALRQLIGELSSFSEQVNALGVMAETNHALPPYNHTDLWGCYLEAQNLISHLLDEITAGPEYVIRLVRDGVYFAAELKPSIFDGKNRFYLAVRADENIGAVVQSMKTLTKLGSREDLRVIVSRALPGLNIEYLALPPQELPRRANTAYFLINHNADLWESVMKNHNIAFYWNNAPDKMDIELMVIGRSS